MKQHLIPTTGGAWTAATTVIRDAVAVIAREQDTGWRKLTPATGVTGNIFMRRRGTDVHLLLHAVVPSTPGNVTICAIPVGFQPQTVAGANWRNGPVSDDAGTSIRQASYYVGHMRILSAEAKAYGGYLTYISSDPFPTMLPGSAA